MFVHRNCKISRQQPPTAEATKHTPAVLDKIALCKSRTHGVVGERARRLTFAER